MPQLATDSQPIVVDFDEGIYLGEDRDIKFTVYPPGTLFAAIRAGTATPQNITGYTFRWTVKLHDEDAVALLVVNQGTDLELLAPTIGEVTVHFRKTMNDALGAGRFTHKLERVDTGFFGRGAVGRLIIHP